MDYARSGVRWLLGATAHPGGEPLTRHVLDRLPLPTGALVADVACGDGATLRGGTDVLDRLAGARSLLGGLRGPRLPADPPVTPPVIDG